MLCAGTAPRCDRGTDGRISMNATPPKRLVWSSDSTTHVGKVRKVNQDACLERPELGLWAVADGMGGHEAGELASARIVEHLRGVGQPADMDQFINSVVDTLQAVNRDLREESARRHGATIGSTVAVLLVFGDQCACIWAGDSRVYGSRGGRLERLTTDHSLVEEYVAQGKLNPQEAEASPAANVITRAVGVEDLLELDVRRFDLTGGDRFLLCSDGLFKEVSEPEMAEQLAGGTCHSVVDGLQATYLQRQARDNLSLVVVDITNPFAA